MSADVEVRENLGNTTLMVAAGRGHLDIVKYMTEDCRADLSATSRNERGEIATRIASDRGHHDIQGYLAKFNVPLLPQAFSSITAPKNSSGSTSDWSIRASEIELLDTCENENIGGEYRVKWLDSEVVLKLFVPGASKVDFEKEVRLWQHLQHPNVIQLYGAVDAGAHAEFFVCEYANRNSLIEFVQASSSVETPMMWKYLYEAALGLEYLHERGIVHGDLRCSNILISSNGLAKLSNVSLSGASERPTSSTVVMPMLWQSPEVLEGRATIA